MSEYNNPHSLKALLILIFGAVCISFAAIFVILLSNIGMGPTGIGYWRTGLGALILFGLAAVSGDSLRLPRRLLGWQILAGFIFFADLFFWHRSVIYCGAGMATILANTQVFGTALLGWFVFKERLGAKFLVTAVAAMIGVTVLVGVGSGVEYSADYLKGVGFGLLTGIIYACYLVVLRKSGLRSERPSFLTLIAWTSLFSALFLGAAGVVEGEPMLPPGLAALGILFILALVAQALGWWAIVTALPKLKAARGGLVVLLQPVLATVWGVLFFSEHLTLLQVVGAALTLGAVYYGSMRRAS